MYARNVGFLLIIAGAWHNTGGDDRVGARLRTRARLTPTPSMARAPVVGPRMGPRPVNQWEVIVDE